LSLGLNLRFAKGASIEGVVGEALQPGPEAERIKTGSLARAIEREADDFVRMHDGVAVLRNAVGEARRIEHGADVIERLGEVFDLLPDSGVPFVPADVTEH